MKVHITKSTEDYHWVVDLKYFGHEPHKKWTDLTQDEKLLILSEMPELDDINSVVVEDLTTNFF